MLYTFRGRLFKCVVAAVIATMTIISLDMSADAAAPTNPLNVTTVAGTGTAGYTCDGCAAKGSEINQPVGIVLDRWGNIVFGEFVSNRIRVVAKSTGTFYGQSMVAGDIYTIAGDGTGGYTCDSCAATSSELNGPQSVALDGQGNVLINDQSNNRIRVVAESTATFYGQSMVAGDIYTIAGDGTGGYTCDSCAATSSELSLADGVAVDASGNVIIADAGNERVRVVGESTATFYGQSMAAGDIYTIAGDGTGGFTCNNCLATSAEVDLPGIVKVDSFGNVLFPDNSDGRVHVLAEVTGTYYGQSMTKGDLYTIAGNGTSGYTCDGCAATSSELNTPNDVALDGSGNVLIADYNNQRVRVVAEGTGTFYGQAMVQGDIYTIAGTGTAGYTCDNCLATSSDLYNPAGIAIDASGNIYVSDMYGNRIRMGGVRGFV